MEIIEEVFWTQRAQDDLFKIFKFNNELKNSERAREIVDSLINFTESSLIEKLDVAVKDQQFSHLRNDYKKLIERNYKVTFRTENKIAYVIRVFDTRQHPEKNN